jgi:hypothetical protein
LIFASFFWNKRAVFAMEEPWDLWCLRVAGIEKPQRLNPLVAPRFFFEAIFAFC